MRENPYEPSSEPAQRVAVVAISGSREDVRSVTLYQRRILFCILLHLVFVGLSGVVRDAQAYELLAGTFVGLVLTWFAGTVLVFLLALKVYGKEVAVLLGLLASIPIIGLIALLMVHNKANSTLKRNGVEVGFLGVNPAHI